MPDVAIKKNPISLVSADSYPCIDTFSGVLTVNFVNNYMSDGGNYSHTDSAFIVYVTLPTQDSIFFNGSYPIGLEGTGDYSAIHFYGAAKVNVADTYETGMSFLYPNHFNSFGGKIIVVLAGNRMSFGWSCNLPVLAICSDDGLSTGQFSGTLVNKRKAR